MWDASESSTNQLYSKKILIWHGMKISRCRHKIVRRTLVRQASLRQRAYTPKRPNKNKAKQPPQTTLYYLFVQLEKSTPSKGNRQRPANRKNCQRPRCQKQAVQAKDKRGKGEKNRAAKLVS